MTHSDYIRIPAHELLRREFCASPVGTLIEDAVRSLAARIGRSAGTITPALKRLRDDGWISYLSDGRGTLIEVLKSDQQTDRSVSSASPRAVPESAPASFAAPAMSDQLPDRSFAASPCDQVPDRSACMVHDSLSQEEESARTPSLSIETDPLYQRLIAEPRMNRKLALQIANHPPGTVADFSADLRIAETFAKLPFFFTVGQWRDGQRVIAPEVCHERPERLEQSSRAGRRSRANTTTHAADPAGQVDIAAIVAEWQRTEPLGPIAMRVPRQRSRAHGD